MPRNPRTELLASVSSALVFLGAVAYFHGQEVGFVYDFLVIPFVYIGVAILLIDFVLNNRRRKEALATIAVGTLILFAAASAATSGYGYPESAYGTSYWVTCTSGQYTNSSSPFPTNFTSCNDVSGGERFSPVALALDFLYLLPLAGLASYALPVWSEGAALDTKAARAVFSLTLMAMILAPAFNVFLVPPM